MILFTRRNLEPKFSNINMGKREGKETRPNPEEKKRIGRLDEQTLGYYRRVSESLQEGFENDEDKGRRPAEIS